MKKINFKTIALVVMSSIGWVTFLNVYEAMSKVAKLIIQ